MERDIVEWTHLLQEAFLSETNRPEDRALALSGLAAAAAVYPHAGTLLREIVRPEFHRFLVSR